MRRGTQEESGCRALPSDTFEVASSHHEVLFTYGHRNYYELTSGTSLSPCTCLHF